MEVFRDEGVQGWGWSVWINPLFFTIIQWSNRLGRRRDSLEGCGVKGKHTHARSAGGHGFGTARGEPRRSGGVQG